MKAFQANLQKLEAADTQVLGVSIDSPFANHAFAEQNGVGFPLLGDVGGNTTKEYGLLTALNVKGVPMETARRATFLIDKNGKIVEESVDSEAVDPSKIVDACERRRLGK
jgi:glutaredoxin-dependent peroxiredoxin